MRVRDVVGGVCGCGKGLIVVDNNVSIYCWKGLTYGGNVLSDLWRNE